MKDWQRIPSIPAPSVPVVGPTGTMSRDWYQWAVAIDRICRGVTELSLNDLADIDATAPADAEVLTYVSANSQWEPA